MQWLRLLTLISADGLQLLVSLCFMFAEQHVKYRMSCGFLLTSSFLLIYNITYPTTKYIVLTVLVNIVDCDPGISL